MRPQLWVQNELPEEEWNTKVRKEILKIAGRK